MDAKVIWGKFLDLLNRIIIKFKKDRVGSYAAESALFIIMGFFPFFMLLMTLIKFTSITPEQIMNMLDEVLPAGFYEVIESIVKELFTSSLAVLSGTVIAAVWATSRSVLAITNGLNSVRDVKENRTYFFMRARSGVYIVFLLIAVLLAIGSLLFGNRMQQALLVYLPGLARFTGVLMSMKALLSISILSLIFLAMYTALPNCRMHIIRQIPGAVFAAFGWGVLSQGFSIYFSFFKKTSLYGSLTTVVMMMLWIYLCMYLVFIGAEVNCYLEYPESFDIDLSA